LKVTDDIRYVGVDDLEHAVFEGQYKMEDGISYNSYVILDDKVAVMDTVDEAFGSRWLDKVEKALGGRMPDYLVIQHMEPDHSANIPEFMEKYPDAKIVSTPQAFKIMKQFFQIELGDKQVNAENGGELDLGNHKLRFIYAPMVHWPEVMITYEPKDKVLFSADAFGKFGALKFDMDWVDEARRYYIGIVGKYGAQVQNVLKKAAELDIKMICPLHGPVLNENLSYYIQLYDTWSSYRPETEGVAVVCASAYGHTMKAASYLAEELKKNGTEAALFNLAQEDISEVMAQAFRYSKLVLACSTYDGGLHPFMQDFLTRLTAHNYQKRKVALIENGSWAPVAAKGMRAMLEKCKEITFVGQPVTLLSAMKPENEGQLRALAEELQAG